MGPPPFLPLAPPPSPFACRHLSRFKVPGGAKKDDEEAATGGLAGGGHGPPPGVAGGGGGGGGLGGAGAGVPASPMPAPPEEIAEATRRKVSWLYLWRRGSRVTARGRERGRGAERAWGWNAEPGALKGRGNFLPGRPRHCLLGLGGCSVPLVEGGEGDGGVASLAVPSASPLPPPPPVKRPPLSGLWTLDSLTRVARSAQAEAAKLYIEKMYKDNRTILQEVRS